MTYVFDLDNTLCNTKNNDYLTCTPIPDRIKKVNKLYEDGNIIIIYTARGMGSSNNNQIEAINKYFSITQAQLKNWDVKYTQLMLGKPAADIYIDDKGIKDNDFFK